MKTDIYVLIEHLRGHVLDISYTALAAARVLAEGTGGKAIAVLLGHDQAALAADLAADNVLYADHPTLAEYTPEAYESVLADLIRSHLPRAVLFGDTSIGSEVASVLSARLELPLVSRCRSVEAGDGTLSFISQICGGKLLAEGSLPEPTTLVAMTPGGYKPDQGRSTSPPPVESIPIRMLEGPCISLRQYIEPQAGDVDIVAESFLVAVGRGIQNQDNVALVEELAEALGGTVCASRPVIDHGWLPSTRLVGKSGKAVKPTVYLALGISGAPEHVEAITSSDVVIAINTDPAAPIFSVAKYGAVIDLFDVVPALIRHVKQARPA